MFLNEELILYLNGKYFMELMKLDFIVKEKQLYLKK